MTVPEYKVGDRVRSVATDPVIVAEVPHGTLGTVVLLSDVLFPLIIDWDNGVPWAPMDLHEVEPLADNSPAA